MVPEVEQRLSKAISDRYKIVREVGAGGWASVFLAEDGKLGRKVAIKVLHPELAASVTGARFLREIQIAAGLAHPHIVPVHDSGEADGLLYFVMRFQEGESLRALLEREGPLPIPRAISIARDVAEGLTYAHARGVIHRDIKPANILLTGDHAVIADFGVARAFEAATMVDMTTTSAVLGTPLYMSPEQVAANPDIDGRSDVYSLGCVLYEMLTGETPFQAKSTVAVLASHLHKDIPSVREIRPEVPPALAEATDRALAKSPEGRFDGAAEMGRVLASVQAELENGGRGSGIFWRGLPGRTRKLLATAAGLSAIALTAAVTSLLLLAGGPALDPTAMVVLPFRIANTTPEEEALLVDLSDELTHQLNRWESVTAVPQIALSGILFDLGLDGPVMDRTEDGLGVAEAMGAGTLAALSARIRGDSVRVTAQLFDPRTGRERGKPHEAWGESRDPSPVAAEVAHMILGLEGSASEIAGLYRQSAVPEALIEYESGQKALEGWRLPEAERSFRRAAALDPTFAMAHHLLSLVLYWEWEEEGLGGEGPGAEAVGEEIALASMAALRNSSGLSLRDSLHILAFNRFQAGDYDAARSHYRQLLERDSADVYAWFLQGSVEYHDPWLTESADGGLRPRSNWNLARRSFAETVRLSPGFHGAYGEVLDIATKVARAAETETSAAPGFEVPRGEFFAPWALPLTPHQKRVFWPVYLDSLVWLDSSTWTGLSEGLASAGASRLLGESVVSLRRWAAFEPDQALPERELARWALFMRGRLEGPQPPERVDSLTVEVFQYASRALALAADTTRNELFQLANLRLAMGDIQGARSAWELAMEWEGPEPNETTPSSASNVLLFSGRPTTALGLLDSERSHTRYYLDPVTNGLIDDGGVDPLIQRLRILGATGVKGAALEAAFQDLADHLAASQDKTPRELDLLRMEFAPRIAVALSLAPGILESWVRELDLKDPLWAALRPEVEGRGDLLKAALEAEDVEVRDPSRSYILGTVAQEIGDDTLAVTLFSRLDSLSLGIQGRDVGWGLLALSYLHRGRAYDAMEDPDRASEFRRRFSRAWSEPEMPALAVREAAR